MYVNKIIFGIMLDVVVKMENIQQVLWINQRLCLMKLQSHTIKKQTVLMKTNFNEKI